jgi:iron complex transport system permease protein
MRNAHLPIGSAKGFCPVPQTIYGSRLALLVAGVCLLGIVSVISLMVGARPMALRSVLDALLSSRDVSLQQIIIIDYRLPRTLLGLLCGAAFGVSGALIQAMTRNPLADPGVLGVNAGAAFFVTVAVGVFGVSSISGYLWASFAGAIIVTLVVYGLGTSSRNGATPVRLVLAGVAISAVLAGFGSSVTLLNPQAFDALRMWSIGSIAGRDIKVVSVVAPFIVAGLVLAFAIARPLNAIALGDDLASTLGANVMRLRIFVVIAVTLLAGAGTAAAGPIAFVGLMVPHAVRWVAGPDQRWIIGLTMLFSPALLLTADIVGRLVLYPGELEAGIVTAFVGAPVLIALARGSKASGL